MSTETLGTAGLQLTQLQTILLETEAIMHTRPLLYVTPDEQQSTVAPADFFQSHTLLSVPILPSDDQDPDFLPTSVCSTASTLLAACKKGQKLSTQQFLDYLENRILDEPQGVTPCPPVATTTREGPTSLHRRYRPGPGSDIPRFVETGSHYSPHYQPR